MRTFDILFTVIVSFMSLVILRSLLLCDKGDTDKKDNDNEGDKEMIIKGPGEPLNFPESRYRHCYNVGLRMFYYAKDVLHWSEERCMSMFVLGNIHDIGYEFFNDDVSQANYVADCIKKTFKYSNELRHHAEFTTKYTSEEMDLLYFADSTVDGFGHWCTFDERLTDLAKRHGVQSAVYKTSLDEINYLRSKGFNDKIQLGTRK